MIRDDFEHDRAPGAVIGSAAADGTERGGIDAEATMAIDDGALRIAYLEQPGWGREAIAYGPVETEPGLAMAALALNGHNASEPHDPPAHGPLAGRRRRLKRALLPWTRPPEPEENLAVGWSEGRGKGSRPPGGPQLSVRPVTGENAALCGRVGNRIAPLVEPLFDLPVLYVVVLRADSAVYYAASGVEGAPGLPALPRMRPLAVDPTPPRAELAAAIEQSVIAESGWRIDSRVGAVRVATVAEPAGTGPPGLVCARLEGSGAEVFWRAGPGPDRFALRLEDGGLELWVTIGGATERLGREASVAGPVFAQVLDDGETIRVLLDGAPAFGAPRRDSRLADRAGAGVGGAVVAFETHPREVAVPSRLAVPAAWDERGEEPLFSAGLAGPAGEEPGVPWRKRVGKGRVLLDGAGGARVDADRAHPNPGRLVYTRPWPQSGFAEIAVDHTPPGAAEGEGEAGRIGLVFMQDPGNYLIVNVWVDDAYPGSSISSFLVLDGEEDHYRAVWCNVGRRVRWGVRSRLAIACDGMRWTARLDGVPVLHRSLRDVYPGTPRLRIEEVGFAANWEWGDDTGSLVHEFSGWGKAR